MGSSGGWPVDWDGGAPPTYRVTNSGGSSSSEGRPQMDSRQKLNSPLPEGTVTFLLTDIEGSTALWETDREGMAQATARHYEILDEAIRQHGGARPQEQGEGDSSVSAFARASDALACALAIQLDMTEESWPEKVLIRVRIGLHSGEAQLRDDGNYFGQTLSRCARLRSIAHGSQTVMSRATYDLVVDNLLEGVSLRDLGEHQLRDIARPERVYQLVHPDLPDEFPTLKSTGSRTNNLPAELTSFVGRESEMAQIRKLLEETRILTLTGSGGCGKTRLALHLCSDLLDEYADGVWWADLAPVIDAQLVPNAVASALLIKEVPGQTFNQTLTQHLRHHRSLLVLDNCEHVVEQCAEMADSLVQACPEIKIVATSREPLGVVGETAWRVPSLSFPPQDSKADMEELLGYEAVRLFVERAVKARPNFQLDADNAPPVAAICNRLEGIPLAIELAAARTRVLSPDQISHGLSDRFHILAGGARTALPRHQTLQASVDWSFNLLTEDERLLLRRLAVFSGGFGLDAAEKVCSGDAIERFRVLDLLSELVDRSLLQVEETQPAARYRLLETIRQYAMQKLADSEESHDVRSSHLDYFLAFVEETQAGLEGPDMLAALETIDVEHDNIRAAMDWAAHTKSADKVLRFARPLFSFWFVRGLFTEATTRIESGLAFEGGSPRLRSEALFVASNLAAQAVVDIPGALSFGEQGVLIAREANDPVTLGLALTNYAFVLTFSDPKRALQCIDEGVELLRKSGAREVTRALQIRGIAEVALGQLQAACRSFAESLELHGERGNPWELLIIHYWLGFARALQGELSETQLLLRRGLELSGELGDDALSAYQLEILGLALTLSGRYADAASCLETSFHTAEAANNLAALVGSRMVRGLLAYAQEDLTDAIDHATFAANMWEQVGYGWMNALSLSYLARISAAAGDLKAAKLQANEALGVAKQYDNVFISGLALTGLATVSSAEGGYREAEMKAREAVGLMASVQSKLGVVDALEALACAIARQEGHAEAARLLGAAEAIRGSIGYVRFPIEERGYLQTLTLVRDALESDGFDAAWSEGKAMSLEEAVAYASKGRGPRKRPATGWASLTPAELDVVRLVAEGLSNPEIAKRLFISPRTVQAHISHIFSKLTVTNRAELAVQAARNLEADPRP